MSDVYKSVALMLYIMYPSGKIQHCWPCAERPCSVLVTTRWGRGRGRGGGRGRGVGRRIGGNYRW